MGSSSLVGGSSLPGPKSSLSDLARLFLSLSGSRDQWDVVAGSAFLAAAISSAGLVPGSVAPEPVAAPSACSSECVSAPGAGSSAGGASVTSSSGLLGHSRDSPCSERRLRCSSSGQRSQSSKRHHGGRFPSPAHFSRLALSSASSSSASSGAVNWEGAMPPPPAGCLALVVVAPGMTIRALSVTALLVLVLWVWSWGRGLRLLPNRLARSLAVVLPPLLWVRGMMTALVSSIPSIWIGMTPLGLFFASSGSSTVWRNRQV